MTFDDTLLMLVSACEQAPGFTSLLTACVVRDLQGRLRLIIDPDPARPPVDAAALEQRLVQDLGSYFAPPILSTKSTTRDEARLAKVVVQKASDWPDAAFDDVVSGKRTRSLAHWKKLERRLSKQAWLESPGGTAPWKLAATTPGIVTFYSFKGGVGRTTALVACAWQLARNGKKVVVIDLDLEAPGLGTLLDVRTSRGVVDLLVDHLATGACELEGAVAKEVPLLGADGDRLQVIPAGRLDAVYLEKLARLDFVSDNPPAGDADEPSPIERALSAILRAVHKQLKPDYILLDSRAGLHDLAGLSLHSLAHVDVLVSPATEQAYLGFDLTLSVLAKRKGAGDLRTVVVHTLAPPEGLPDALVDEAQLRHRSYEAFCKYVYKEKSQTIPEDAEGLHQPVPLRRNGAFDRFLSIAKLETYLFGRDYTALRKAIEDKCAP